MALLAIECALGVASVAVRGTDGRAAHRLRATSAGIAEALVPMVRDCAAEAGVDLARLRRIAVTRGPGTFTGVRVAVSAARAFALVSGAGIVATTSLAVIARAALREGVRGVPIVVAVPGPRGELIAEPFAADTGESTGPVRGGLAAALLDLLAPGSVIVGRGASAVAGAARETGRSVTTAGETMEPDARVLADMAPGLTVLAGPLRPLYLRPADARPVPPSTLVR